MLPVDYLFMEVAELVPPRRDKVESDGPAKCGINPAKRDEFAKSLYGSYRTAGSLYETSDPGWIE